MRATDAVGRLGGDEFAVLMPGTSFKGAKTASDKIHKELLRTVTESHWPIGFSIGVAAFPALPGSIDDALKVADRLMYKAKNTGKNHVVCELQPVHMAEEEVLTVGPDVFADEGETIRTSTEYPAPLPLGSE